MAEHYLGNTVLGFIQRSLPKFRLVQELQEAPAAPAEETANYPLLPAGDALQVKRGFEKKVQ